MSFRIPIEVVAVTVVTISSLSSLYVIIDIFLDIRDSAQRYRCEDLQNEQQRRQDILLVRMQGEIDEQNARIKELYKSI